MDVPTCNVCHLPLDEEEQQPRHLGCGHDACTTCIKALIYYGLLVCPMCRTIIKADKPEDLHINYGVVQILRLFKGFKMSENKANEYGATANTKEICNIHKHAADKRCITCNLWICVQCEELHILDVGCEIQDYNEFLKKGKKEHKEKVESTLLCIRNKLRSLSSKLSRIDSDEKKLEEEMKKLEEEMKTLAKIRKNLLNAVEEGTKTLNEVVTASAKVEIANTSKELNESVEIAKAWHQFAQIWCKKNSKYGLRDSLFEKLEVDNEVYASMDINGKSSHCRLTIEDNIYLHCFRMKGFNINKSLKIFPYEQIQSQLPAVRDLVFLDLAICGEVKGRVTIRIRQDLPSYAKNIPLLFTGEGGHSLLGLNSGSCGGYNLLINIVSITNNIDRDANAGYKVTQGSILAFWSDSNINYFFIYHESGDKQPYDNNYEVFGQVETGLDIVKICRKHKKQKEVTVADCGLVIKEDLLKKF